MLPWTPNCGRCASSRKNLQPSTPCSVGVLLAAATLEGEERLRLEQLVGWLGTLADVAEPLESMNRCRIVIRSVQAMEDETLADQLLRAAQRQRDYCVEAHDRLFARMASLPNPIAPKAEATVGDFLSAGGIRPLGDPAVLQPPFVADMAEAFDDRLLFLYFRVLGEVARLAIAAERAQVRSL